MQISEVKNLIETAIPKCTVDIQSQDGSHFNAVIISDLFLGKSKVARQQMVYSALGECIKNGSIHAISLQTYTSNEWSGKSK